MLPKEKQFTPVETLGVAWGLAWRMIVVAIPIVLVSKLLQHYIPHYLDNPLLKLIGSILDLAANLVAYWLAVHWLFHSGKFGINKVILMDEADYQELSNRLTSNPSPK